MSLKTPKTRHEFESHINIVVERSSEIIPKTFSIRLLKSMLNAKNLPNKRDNFLTIDEQVRLLANSHATFDRMRQFPNLYKPMEDE